MGLQDLMKRHASKVFCNPAGFGEPIAYTAYVAGVAQPAVTTYAIIDRSAAVAVVSESGGGSTKQLAMQIPRGGSIGIPIVNIGDVVAAPWRVGDVPNTFRIVERINQDIAMWEVVAESSIN